jgi:hypothetical protein
MHSGQKSLPQLLALIMLLGASGIELVMFFGIGCTSSHFCTMDTPGVEFVVFCQAVNSHFVHLEGARA